MGSPGQLHQRGAARLARGERHRQERQEPGAAEAAARPKPFIQQMVDYVRAASPLPQALEAREVGDAAAFLCSPLASGITGTVIHIDKGYHAMGKAP